MCVRKSFLGHTISAEGIKSLLEKIQTIVAEFQEPATVKGLRRFLGMFNFYSLSQRPLLQTPLLNVISERKRNNAKIK